MPLSRPAPLLLALALALAPACGPEVENQPLADDALDGGDGGADAGTDVGTDGSTDGSDGVDDGTDGVPIPGPRGVWAWRDAGDPNGTDAVVGDPVAEAAMIATLQDWGVTRVYGSYGDRPLTEPAVIANWNAQLDAAGIDSQLLLGDPAYISSREWANMLEKIDQRLLAFNAGVSSPDQAFDALHLDIEPQAASDWSGTTDEDRWGRLLQLQSTFHTVREHLDGTTGAAIPIEADLAVWFDNLPASLGGTGSIGWPMVADRDAWFVDLGAEVAGVSFMSYERATDVLIIGSVATEAGLYPGTLRVSLNEEVGTTWSTVDEIFDMAQTLEDQGQIVDLHSYSALKALLP